MLANVGSDLRELASAVSQLVADTGGKVTEAAVETYYSGRAEVRGFEIADKAVTGDRAGALEALAWAMHHGTRGSFWPTPWPRPSTGSPACGDRVGKPAICGITAGDAAEPREEATGPGGGVGQRVDRSRSGRRRQAQRRCQGQAADADYSLEHAVSTVAGCARVAVAERRATTTLPHNYYGCSGSCWRDP